MTTVGFVNDGRRLHPHPNASWPPSSSASRPPSLPCQRADCAPVRARAARSAPGLAGRHGDAAASDLVPGGQGVSMSPDPRTSSLALSYGGSRGDGLRPQEPGVGRRRPAIAVGPRALRGGPLAGPGRVPAAPAAAAPGQARRVAGGVAPAPARRSGRAARHGHHVRRRATRCAIVLEASEKVPFQVNQEEKRVTVSIARGAGRDRAAAGPAHGRHRGLGAVPGRARQRLRDRRWARRFQQLKASEEEHRAWSWSSRPRPLTVAAAATPAARRPRRAAGTAPPSDARRPRSRCRADCSGRDRPRPRRRGGRAPGARAATLEKDVTLAIARKLRACAREQAWGVQAFLTRDRDMEVPLDERAAFANNYKADLFISIHANASRSHGAQGSEVYFLSYQSTDEESRRLAASEGAAEMSQRCGRRGGLGPRAHPVGHGAGRAPGGVVRAGHAHPGRAGRTSRAARAAASSRRRSACWWEPPCLRCCWRSRSSATPRRRSSCVSEAYQNKVVGAVVRGVARYQQQRAAVAGGAAAESGRP